MTLSCPSCAAPIEAGAEACKTCGRSLGTPAVGSVLASRYELRDVLGRGGMGLVYRAFDRLLEEEVAIKVLRTDLSANTEALRRFRTEIKLARKVSHPNVCRIHDYGEEGPLAYISMEILTGEDLHKSLGAHPQGLPEEEALSAILQVASGLQAIHDVGVLHRDLKTANVSRDERGTVRLVDFGIAKDLEAEEHTRAGEAFGTPEYMSPELCRGEPLDFRSDIYALGILAFELLTGEVPIRSTTAMATLYKQIQEMPSFDREPGARVPRRFVPVIRRALQKAPDDRFATARDFAQALRAAALEEAAAVSPKTSAGGSKDAAPAPVFKDVRKDERIHLPTDIVIRRPGTGGAPEKEERTVAHDLSRSGMRVLTSWSDLQPGDKVGVVEVGGDFATGAIVRNIHRGADHITRVGLEFVGSRAPDRLVGTADTLRPPTPTRQAPVASAPAPPTPQPTPRARPTPPPFSLAQSGTPLPGNSVGPSLSPFPPERVTPRNPLSTTATTGGHGSSARIPVRSPAGREVAKVTAEVGAALAEARRLTGESRIEDALKQLLKAQEMASGEAESLEVRVLLLETQAKVPKLSRGAQRDLEELARQEPRNLVVQLALGRCLLAAGLSSRARMALGRALAIDPSNREAVDSLATLNQPGPWRR